MMATLLAKRGWEVTVHERREVVGEIGAGIFLHSNGLLVLEEAGLMEELAPMGERLLRDLCFDLNRQAAEGGDFARHLEFAAPEFQFERLHGKHGKFPIHESR